MIPLHPVPLTDRDGNGGNAAPDGIRESSVVVDLVAAIARAMDTRAGLTASPLHLSRSAFAQAVE